MIRKTSFLLAAFAVFISLTGAGSGEPPQIPDLLSVLRETGPPDFCGEPAPMDIPGVRERFEKELLLNLWDRPQMILYLKRSRRFFPTIESVLSAEGMPGDLRYVAVIESALRPHARSSRGAVGFWQFMPETARKYGLTVNRFIDERRCISASTRAAVKYFRELHDIFGSWTLAAAAYNMGEQGLLAESEVQKTRDYYLLHLPSETQRFIFRIMAVKTVFSDPAKYGFDLEESDYYAPPEFDRIEITRDSPTPLQLIAEAAGTHFKRIKDLNPQIRGHYLDRGTHRVLVPPEGAAGFHERFERLLAAHALNKSKNIYIVRPGDSLSLIAERFGVPLMSLLIWNRLDMNRPIHPGDRLVVYGEMRPDVAEKVD